MRWPKWNGDGRCPGVKTAGDAYAAGVDPRAGGWAPMEGSEGAPPKEDDDDAPTEGAERTPRVGTRSSAGAGGATCAGAVVTTVGPGGGG